MRYPDASAGKDEPAIPPRLRFEDLRGFREALELPGTCLVKSRDEPFSSMNFFWFCNELVQYSAVVWRFSVTCSWA